MVISFFKDTLSGLCLVSLVAFFVSMSAGSMYAWAAYSTDLRDHFGWTLAQATSVNTAGIFGDSLLAIFMGIVLNSYGPVVAMASSTALMSGSFFMLYWLAAGGWSSVPVASFLYTCNGNGSIGFYFCALFTVTTCWPATLVGTGVAVMDVAFSMSSVVVARAYPMVASITAFYLIMASLTLVVGISLLLCHINWALVAWGTEADKTSEVSEMEAGVGAGPMPARSSRRLSVPTTPGVYGSMQNDSQGVDSEGDETSKPTPMSLRKRSSVVGDMVITHRVNDSDISQIFGLMPCTDELKAKYNKMSIVDALRTSEFLVSGTFSFFCFTSTAVMTAQLATVKRQMDVGLDTSTLLTTVMVCAAVGKLGGGAMSDATAQSKYFCRQFYIFAANAVIFVSFTLLAFLPHSDMLLLVVLGALGVARGAGSVIFTTLLKESFGARMLGVFVGLVYVLFFFGYAIWGALFVMCNDGVVVVSFWKIVTLGCMVPLTMSFRAWRQQVQGH